MTLILLRIGCIVVALVIWFWTQKLIASKSDDMEGIGDWVHRLTAGWHRYLSTHEKTANRLLIISSFCIMLGEATVVLVLRAHYTMDVITGAFAAWFAADLANRIAPWLDSFFQ